MKNLGIRTIVYPVKDIAKAKALYRDLLGVEPYADSAFYVGFKVDGLDIGLDPNGHKEGETPYYAVDDIRKSVKGLVADGAKIIEDVHDVGGGRLIASVRDADSNIIGLLQDTK